MAGHSLGEYSALCAAGAMSLETAVRLVRFRAEAMQSAVPVGVGGMAAVIGLADDAVEAAVAEARETGKVEGRNEQIETRRVRTQKTDGLPADGGGVEATSAVKTDKDIIDEVITRRNKRRF